MKSRILFVETSPDISDVVRIFLENHYYVGYSPSSSDALHKVENDENIRLIVYSNDPPILDGLDFLKIIRKHRMTIPFILLGDDNDISSEIEIIKNSLYVNKPIEIETLLQIIEAIIPASYESKERRKYPRIKLNKSATIKHLRDGKEIDCLIENISLGGMRVKLDKFIDSFEENELIVNFDNLTFEIQKQSTIYSEDGIRFGVEFKSLNETTYHKIENLIKKFILESISASRG
jgi:DNA-binding response OmpR family regulator